MSVTLRSASAPIPVPRDEAELDECLSDPRLKTVEALRHVPGGSVVLGGGQKMGPTLSRMAVRAAALADRGEGRRVIAVSRFGDGSTIRSLERHGVETIQAGLLDPD